MKTKLLCACLIPLLSAGLVAADEKSGYLGVEITSVKEEVDQYVFISGVHAGTGAAEAGIRKDDRLIEIDGWTINLYEDLVGALAKTRPNDKVDVRVLRDGTERSFTVVLGERPETVVLRNVLKPVTEGGKWTFRVSPNRVHLGIETDSLGEQLARYFGVSSGVLVKAVDSEGPAESAGLLAGDVIVAVENRAIENSGRLKQALNDTNEGEEIQLTVNRRGDTLRVYVTPVVTKVRDVTLSGGKLELLHDLSTVSLSGNVEISGDPVTVDLITEDVPERLRREITELQGRIEMLQRELRELED